MTSVLDNAVLIGEESTYGTPATLTRGYEAKADGWKRLQEPLESVGMRGGIETMRSDRRIQINMGGEGEIEFDIQKNGLGLLLQAMLGSSTGPTQEAATAAYKTTATTGTTTTPISYTVQIQRIANDLTTQSHTHHGAVIKSWGITQDVGGLLMAKIGFDSEDVDNTTGDGTPAYPTTTQFHWGQCVVELDSVATDAMSFSVQEDLALKTDRRFLRGDVLKKKPLRAGMPSITGSVQVEYTDDTQYDDWVAGNIIPIIATWTGAVIEAPYNEELKITMAACQYSGDSPQASLSDVATIDLPFTVLDNGTDPAVQIEYTSTDTAL